MTRFEFRTGGRHTSNIPLHKLCPVFTDVRFLSSSAEYKEPISCYKCDGNNEECSLATMHADIERYTVRCIRDYQRCITVILEQDGRRIISKRCANESICKKKISHCEGSERSSGGRQTEKMCYAWCCEGYMCNNGPRLFPVHLVIMACSLLYILWAIKALSF